MKVPEVTIYSDSILTGNPKKTQLVTNLSGAEQIEERNLYLLSQGFMNQLHKQSDTKMKGIQTGGK